MPVSAGTRLGPYEILAALGAGGMGEVYKAKDTRLGRTVAVKLIGNRFLNRFEREARAIAALAHPHICTLYDVGPDYLVMEYIDGKPLKGHFEEAEALRLAVQMAQALEEAHRKGVIHLDLKPANIMLTAGGSVKLLDFGLASLSRPDDPDITRTSESMVAGTAGYMSPEQAEGKPLDERSDIFSFGAVLYEMLAGRPAFAGDSLAAVLSALHAARPAPLRATPAVERIVSRCLEKDAALRFQTIKEVRIALETASANGSEPQPSIAVLPFADLSAMRDNEYFSDGLTAEIINALAHIYGLKVIAQTSAFAFKGKNEDIRRIAGVLGVTHVLEGSVRKSGNRIRVTAQLISASDGSHLWSERYDREMADVFAMQDDIAAAIAKTLQLKLMRQPECARHRPNLPAYEAYMMGLYQTFKTTRESIARADEHFQEAIALDPAYALPQFGRGLQSLMMATWSLQPAHEAMPLARAAAHKALALDASLAEAHALLGVVAAMYDYDWQEAERRFRLALAADQVSSFARAFYAQYYLLPLGRAREAVEEMERVIESDPLNVLYRGLLGLCIHAAGMMDRATMELEKALKLEGNHWVVHQVMATNYVACGMAAEARAAAEKAYQLSPWWPQVVGLLAGTLALTGGKNRSEQLLGQLRESPSHRIPVGMTIYHLICSEANAAVDCFEKAIALRDVWAPRYSRLQLTKILRSHPRWPELMRMMNLPEMT